MPWRRLTKEWVIYASIMTVVFAIVVRDGARLVPILGGLLVSGPLYLLLGYVLAKLGYSAQDACRAPDAAGRAGFSGRRPER